MNDPAEELLKQMTLVKPTESLDEAILQSRHSETYLTAEKHISTGAQSGPGWWVVGFSAVACSLVGITIGLVFARGPQATTAVTDVANVGQSPKNSVSYAENSRSDELTTDADTHQKNSPIQLSDQGLYFLNGAQPVRKYRSRTWRQVRTWDAKSGTERSFRIPVWQIVLAPAPGV